MWTDFLDFNDQKINTSGETGPTENGNGHTNGNGRVNGNGRANGNGRVNGSNGANGTVNRSSTSSEKIFVIDSHHKFPPSIIGVKIFFYKFFHSFF